MNLVELELDETLADFEVQDWIDNVFSVQYPYVKARIKKGCSGLCHKKDEWHYVKDGDLPERGDADFIRILIVHHNHITIANYDGDWKSTAGHKISIPYAWKELPKELKENE